MVLLVPLEPSRLTSPELFDLTLGERFLLLPLLLVLAPRPLPRPRPRPRPLEGEGLVAMVEIVDGAASYLDRRTFLWLADCMADEKVGE